MRFFLFYLPDKNGLVEIKGCLKTYYRVNYFFPVLKPFLNDTVFYVKLSWRFSGPKIKVTWLIAEKCGTNMQMNNFKLLSKFYVL